MEGKLILNQAIIDEVIAKSGTGPKGFTYPKLIEDLIGFVGENKVLIGSDLYREFSKSGLADDKKLRLALLQNKDGAGAMPGLRNLLCFYAYGKSYEKVIVEELGSSLEREIEFDKKTRREKQTFDTKIQGEFSSLRERLGNVNENISGKIERLTEFVEHNQKTNEKNTEYSKASDVYFESIKKGDKIKMREALETMTTVLSERMDEEIRLLSYLGGELMVEKIHTQEYETAVELGERICKLSPDESLLNFYTAHALHACKKYNEALVYLNRNLEMYPYEGENVFLKILTLYSLDEFKSMLDLTEDALRMYREGKLYRVLSTMSFASFKITYTVVKADKLILRNLLRVRIMALTSNKATNGLVLNAINDFLEMEDDLDLMKSKLAFIRKQHDEFLKYCESCSRIFPQETFFLLHLIAAQIQKQIKRGKILKNVLKLVAIKDDDANYQLRTDSVFKPLWNDPDFEKIINGDRPSLLWKFR